MPPQVSQVIASMFSGSSERGRAEVLEAQAVMQTLARVCDGDASGEWRDRPAWRPESLPPMPAMVSPHIPTSGGDRATLERAANAIRGDALTHRELREWVTQVIAAEARNATRLRVLLWVLGTLERYPDQPDGEAMRRWIKSHYRIGGSLETGSHRRRFAISQTRDYSHCAKRWRFLGYEPIQEAQDQGMRRARP